MFSGIIKGVHHSVKIEHIETIKGYSGGPIYFNSKNTLEFNQMLQSQIQNTIRDISYHLWTDC